MLMNILIKNIGELAGIVPAGVVRKQGHEMDEVESIKSAYLMAQNGIISAFGPMAECPEPGSMRDTESTSGDFIKPSFDIPDSPGWEVIDAGGGMVLPTFCDSHTHICYAGTREQEFIDKIEGLSYAEIAARGGGILNSADLLHRTSENEIYSQTIERVNEMIAKGTGAIEIKSGYGLTLEDELKMLRIIRRIKETTSAVIKATLLGAHAIGRGYSHEAYVDLVCNEMIPAAASEGLAEYVDVFCEDGFFSVEDADRIMTEGEKHGLVPKIHANQLACSGGVQVAAAHDALSVDHLEDTGEAEIEALQGRRTMPTMLPGASFFLNMQYGRAKEYINAGLGVALASDYNPGSSPSGDMRFVMSLGCIKMRLTPAQAFNACTLNSAYAMGVSDILGSITAGKKASLIITKPIPSLAYIPYCHQSPFIRKVILPDKT